MLKWLYNSMLTAPDDSCFDGEDDDEQILYIFRRSFITNFDWIFITLALLIVPFIADALLALVTNDIRRQIPLDFVFAINLFWYVFTFGYILANYLNWYFNVYIITNKRIVDMDFTGIAHKNISEAALFSIEDVTSEVSGALRFTFNYGNVYIQTAAEKTEFEFTDVADPAKVRDILSDLVANLKRVR